MSRAKSQFPVKPTIVIDTREKLANRLFSVNLQGDDQVAAYIQQKVDAGDYTILEMPDLVVIEKKERRQRTLRELHLEA